MSNNPIGQVLRAIVSGVFFAVIFAGCALMQPEIKTTPAVIIFKSPKLKFADTGYIRERQKRLIVEVYTAGQPVDALDIGEVICMKEGCLGKKEFTYDYLSPSYPPQLLERVLTGKTIFNAQALQETAEGFEQHLVKAHAYDITYKVESKTIYFKDTLNKILIKIKKLNPQGNL